MKLLNKALYIIDRPVIAFPLAAIVGAVAGFLDSLIRALIEAAQWGML